MAAKQVEIGIKIRADGKEFAGVAQLSKRELDKLNRSAKNTNKSFANMAKETVNLKGIIAGLGVSIGGLAAAQGLKNVINDMDQIGKMSTRLGISTEALSELRHAADLTGVGFNTLTMGLQRMTRRVAEAANGTGAAKNALRELHIDAANLVKLAPDKMFEVLADAIASVEQPADKVRLAMKLFDSEGVALLQTMEGGAEAIRQYREEANRLHLTLTQNMTDAAARANDSLTKLGASFGALGNYLAVKFVPILNTVTDALLDITGLSDTALISTVKEIGEISLQIDNLKTSLKVLPLFTGNREGLLADLEERLAGLKLLARAYQDSGKEMNAVSETAKPLADNTEKLASANKTLAKSIGSVKKELTEQEQILKRQQDYQQQQWDSSVDLVNSYHDEIDALVQRIDTFNLTNSELVSYNRNLLEMQLREDDVKDSMIATTLALYDQKAALQEVASEQEAAAANSGGSFFGSLLGDIGDEIGKIDLQLGDAFSGWILGTKDFGDAIVDIWAQMFGSILNLAVKFITDKIMTQLFSGAGWISSLAAAIGIAIYGVLKSGPASATRPDPSRTTTSGDPRAPGFNDIVTGDVLARDQVYLLDSQAATNLNIQLSIMADQFAMFSGEITDFTLELTGLTDLWNQASLAIIDSVAGISPEIASLFGTGSTGLLEIAMADGGVAVLDGSSGASGAGDALGQIGAVVSVLGAAYTIYSLVQDWDDMSGIQKATGVLSAVSATVSAIGAIASAAGAAIQVIPVIGWVIAAIVQILTAVQTFQSGNVGKGVSEILGGQLGGLLHDAVFPVDNPDAIFRTSNDTISEVPKGTATTMGGGAIGVESLLGVTTAGVRNAGDIADQEVLEMFGPILEAIAQVDNGLAMALNRMDQGLTLGLFKEALGSLAETDVEFVQDLEKLEVAEFIRTRFHQIFNKLGETGTEVGVAMDEWFNVLDGVFGAEFTLGVVGILSDTIEDLMAIPNDLVHFMDDRLKSGKVGGTPEDALQEVQDVLLSYELLTQGFEGLGASVDNTVIVEFLANMTEIGFATKDAAIGVLAYASALKGANQELQGAELGDAIVQGVNELIDYANTMQMTNVELSALIGTFAQFSGVFNELGLEYTMDDLFVLSGQVDTLARESQDAALEVEGASSAIKELGVATGEALGEILNQTLFFARWIKTAGGDIQQMGVSGLEFVDAARGFVGSFDNMEAAATAFNEYLTAFFSDSEIASMQQQWANDALANFVSANTQFAGIDPRNMPAELWIDPLVKSFLQLAGAAKRADDAVNGLSESSNDVARGSVSQGPLFSFSKWFRENVTDQLGESTESTEHQLAAVTAKFDLLEEELWKLGEAAGVFSELFPEGAQKYLDALNALEQQETSQIIESPEGINEWAQAVQEWTDMVEAIGQTDLEKQLADIRKEFDAWRDKARELAPDGELSTALQGILDVERQVIEQLLADRQAARDALLDDVGMRYFIETASEFQGSLAQLANGFLDTLQQMVDLGGGMEDFETIMDIAMKTGTKKLTEYMQQVTDEFEAIFDRIEGASKGIQKNIDQLLGVGVDQQLASAYAELNSTDDLDEQLALIAEIQALIMQRYQDEVNGIESVNAVLANFKDLVDGFKVDDNLSPLSNQGRLNEARSQYSTLLVAAQAGDAEAVNKLGGAATEYLNEAKSFFASSKDYAQIFANVTDALTAMGVVSTGGDDGDDTADKTLTAQQESVDELRQLQDLLDELLLQQKGQLDVELTKAHNEAIFIANEFARRAKDIIAGAHSDTDIIAGSDIFTRRAIDNGTRDIVDAVNDVATINETRLNAIKDNLLELGITLDPADPNYGVHTILGEIDGGLSFWFDRQMEWYQHLFNSSQGIGLSVQNGNAVLRDIFRAMGGDPTATSRMATFAGGGIATEASIFGEAGREAAVPIPNGFIPARVYGSTESPQTVEELKKLNQKIERMEQSMQHLEPLTDVSAEGFNTLIRQAKRQADAQSKMADEAALNG